MRLRISFLVVAAVFLCSSLLPAQTITSSSFVYGGQSRSYRVYRPAIYNGSAPVSLILNLHGYGSDNMQQELYGDFRQIADTVGFILVHPNGTVDGTGNRFWNSFGQSNVDDVGFLNALIDTISSNYNIDANRIYSTGMSNGGFMSYDLACQLGHKITAIASVTGSMISSHLNTCSPLHPTPIMEIHGTADPTVPYSGGTTFTHIDSLVKHWVDFNNCNPSPTVTQVPNTDPLDGCTAEHSLYTGGDLGTTVEFYKIIGGGHTWPGANFTIGVTNQDFKASVEIWRFFRQFSLDNLYTSRSSEVLSGILLKPIYPNPSQKGFYLDFRDATAKTIKVSNLLGQVLQSQECTSKEFFLELDQPGLFLISIEQNGKVWTEKVMRN